MTKKSERNRAINVRIDMLTETEQEEDINVWCVEKSHKKHMDII
jgi:hypothetical protein